MLEQQVLLVYTFISLLHLDNSVKLMVSLFETTLPYECEYQGHECCFVPTLMTDHAFLALSHVITAELYLKCVYGVSYMASICL